MQSFSLIRACCIIQKGLDYNLFEYCIPKLLFEMHLKIFTAIQNQTLKRIEKQENVNKSYTANIFTIHKLFFPIHYLVKFHLVVNFEYKKIDKSNDKKLL